MFQRNSNETIQFMLIIPTHCSSMIKHETFEKLTMMFNLLTCITGQTSNMQSLFHTMY